MRLILSRFWIVRRIPISALVMALIFLSYAWVTLFNQISTLVNFNRAPAIGEAISLLGEIYSEEENFTHTPIAPTFHYQEAIDIHSHNFAKISSVGEDLDGEFLKHNAVELLIALSNNETFTIPPKVIGYEQTVTNISPFYEGYLDNAVSNDIDMQRQLIQSSVVFADTRSEKYPFIQDITKDAFLISQKSLPEIIVDAEQRSTSQILSLAEDMIGSKNSDFFPTGVKSREYFDAFQTNKPRLRPKELENGLFVSVGLYAQKTNFERVWDTLNDKGFQIAKSYVERHNAHRISIGPFSNKKKARITLSVAKIMGFYDAYIY